MVDVLPKRDRKDGTNECEVKQRNSGSCDGALRGGVAGGYLEVPY